MRRHSHVRPMFQSRLLQQFAVIISLVLLASACAPAAEDPDDGDVAAPDAEGTEPDEPDETDEEVGDEDLEAYFSGERITITVGFGPGGLHDTHARIVAEFLPQYLPGSPEVIVQNVEGGQSGNAIRTVMSADPDGTSIVGYTLTARTPELMGLEGPDIDWEGLRPIGSAIDAHAETSLVWIRSDVAGSFEEARAQGATFSCVGLLVNCVMLEAFVPEINMIHGYDGVPDSLLAADSGETDGDGNARPQAVLSTVPHWVEEGAAFPVAQIWDIGMYDEPPNQAFLDEFGLEQPPALDELVELDATELEVLHAVRVANMMGTVALGVHNDTPDHIRQALEDALEAVANDPDFQEELRSRDHDPGWHSGQEMLDHQRAIEDISEEAREQLRFMMDE